MAGRAFILVNYVVDKKHASSIVDLEASVAKHTFAVKEAEAKSKSKEVQNAKQKIEDFKRRASHHLLLAAQLLLDPDVMRGMAAISLARRRLSSANRGRRSRRYRPKSPRRRA